MDAYATTDQLDTWVGSEVTLPADAEQLLRWATVIVAKACNLNPYQPVDPSSVQALQDATCAQANPWVSLAISVRPWTVSTGLTAGTAPVKKSTILSADVEVDTSGQVKQVAAADAMLVAEAEAILQQAGLLWQAVPLGADPFDQLPQWGQGRTWYPFAEPLSGEYEWPWGGGELWP